MVTSALSLVLWTALLVLQDRPSRAPDVFYVPTPPAVVEAMLKMASVSSSDVVYDLGCGDGRIPVTAAREYGCKARGVDLDPKLVEESLANVRKHGVERLVTIAAAQKYGARGIGIDIDPARIAEAKENAKAAGVTDKVTFLEQDLFTSDFKDATVVTLYLLPSLNQKLMPKLKAELKPGTRIVSHAFDMGPEWPPEKKEEVEGKTIYFWTIR